ncbi:DUF6461 domain-containing protein [Embleya scabrispora]|uniref:DUF6461 domain-containing protein n=1 Tax=Embleya scabrispora TaxID=159449 RepID=UPI00131A2369|nr:hypothetical protein [Streptomyces sp. SID5474]
MDVLLAAHDAVAGSQDVEFVDGLGLQAGHRRQEFADALTIFHYADSGDVVCGFDRPRDRWGSDPDRLVPHLTRAGLLLPDGIRPDHGIDERQRLTHRMMHAKFGTTLPREDVEHGELLAAMY